MKPSLLGRTLAGMIAVRQPVMVWGPPGCGKSSIVAQVAQAYGGFVDLRLPLMDAVDLRGIPVVQNGRGTVWMTPEMFPRKGKGVLFLDEIAQSLPIVQSAASSLILDRRIGEYTLPDGWVVIGASNLEVHRAATYRMPSHIANRFVHLNLEVDAEDWMVWADANGVNEMVKGYIAFRPDELLYKFDPSKKVNATPRSWVFLSNILNGGDVDEGLFEVVAGTVGEGVAASFVGFTQTFREMPDYETVCAKPETTKIPENVAARYAVATMLAGRTKQEDMKQIVKYVDRMSKEFQILTMNDMTKRNKKLAETSSYINWAAKNKDVLLNATAR